MRFRDRGDAGRQLAWRLQQYRREAPVVVGLPRCGVPVAAEVARALGAPLDVLVVRKLGCHWQPELALGALGEAGAIVVNHSLIASIGLPPRDLVDVVQAERAELARRIALAVPVAPPQTIRALGAVADEVVALTTPRAFLAIGQFYDDFSQTSDEEVVRLLANPEPVPAGLSRASSSA
jgi:predicted phosphoribosyltransferase